MIHNSCTLVIMLLVASVIEGFRATSPLRPTALLNSSQKEELDSQGYIIKPRDWFNGLSGDPGGNYSIFAK